MNGRASGLRLDFCLIQTTVTRGHESRKIWAVILEGYLSLADDDDDDGDDGDENKDDDDDDDHRKDGLLKEPKHPL